MATAQTTNKRPHKTRKANGSKAVGRPLSHAQLLKLAAKHRPPQSWYDEQIDPTKPVAPARRER